MWNAVNWIFSDNFWTMITFLRCAQVSLKYLLKFVKKNLSLNIQEQENTNTLSCLEMFCIFVQFKFWHFIRQNYESKFHAWTFWVSLIIRKTIFMLHCKYFIMITYSLTGCGGLGVERLLHKRCDSASAVQIPLQAENLYPLTI